MMIIGGKKVVRTVWAEMGINGANSDWVMRVSRFLAPFGITLKVNFRACMIRSDAV